MFGCTTKSSYAVFEEKFTGKGLKISMKINHALQTVGTGIQCSYCYNDIDLTVESQKYLLIRVCVLWQRKSYRELTGDNFWSNEFNLFYHRNPKHQRCGLSLFMLPGYKPLASNFFFSLFFFNL